MPGSPLAEESEAGQAEAVAWLREAGNMGAPVEEIRTHAARVFLAGGRAWKIKRAVRYDYLDFTDLDRRRAMLERELVLNGRAAPDIYHDVVALTRAAGGGLELDGAGQPVEWVLRMTRFRAEDELSAVAERGALDTGLAERLGHAVAAYHATTEPRPMPAASGLIAAILDELERVFADLGAWLEPADTAAFCAVARTRLGVLAALLDRRGRAGAVRRCHGDLHLGNIVLIDGGPVPFDALEFDETLGTCDLLYDLGFLLMDLEHRGLGPQANAVLNAWLSRAPEPIEDAEEGLAALPLFLGVRAAIRAMVDAQTARLGAGHGTEAAHAPAYLAAARGFLSPAPPRLVAVGGLSGSGKTDLARRIAPRLGPPPGAIHLRSDTERKAMLGAGPFDRLPASAYDAETGQRVYARLRARAVRLLAAGRSVVLDASHLDPSERAASAALARRAGAPFAGLWLEAPEAVLAARVTARRGDASDATAAVVARQAERDAGAIDWHRIDAAGSREQTFAEAIRAIEQDQSRDPPRA